MVQLFRTSNAMPQHHDPDCSRQPAGLPRRSRCSGGIARDSVAVAVRVMGQHAGGIVMTLDKQRVSDRQHPALHHIAEEILLGGVNQCVKGRPSNAPVTSGRVQ